MKHLTTLFAALAVLLFAACSDYTDTIPADTKLLGKTDFAVMQDQSGMDLMKMLNDAVETIQDSNDDFPDVNEILASIDLSAPMYYFLDGEINKDPFIGVVLKVSDSEGLVEAIDRALLSSDDISKSDLKKLKKEEDGYTVYQPKNEHMAFGISDKALLVLVGPESSDRKIRERLLTLLAGEEKGIKDNELYKTMKGHDAFASVYASLDVIPDKVMKDVNEQFKREGIRLKASQLKTLTVGLDASVSGKVADVNFWYQSSDEEFQEKLEQLAGYMKQPTDDGLQIFTPDILYGVVLNIDGSELANNLSSICSTLGFDKNKITDEMKSMIRKLKGNVLFGYLPHGRDFWAAQTSNMNDFLIKQYAPDYEGHENWSQDDFSYSDRPYYELTHNGTEFVKLWSYSRPDYFGYKNGFSYYADGFDIANNALDDDPDMPAELSSLIQSNRITAFLSVESLLSEYSDDLKEVLDEVASDALDKIEYVTFSLK
mgnify:CR=1 FL=1